ncbi:DUF723 domain-containing protein [Mesorhizobium sp. M0185]
MVPNGSIRFCSGIGVPCWLQCWRHGIARCINFMSAGFDAGLGCPELRQ